MLLGQKAGNGANRTRFAKLRFVRIVEGSRAVQLPSQDLDVDTENPHGTTVTADIWRGKHGVGGDVVLLLDFSYFLFSMLETSGGGKKNLGVQGLEQKGGLGLPGIGGRSSFRM